MVSTQRRPIRTIAFAALLGAANLIVGAASLSITSPARAQAPLFPELRTDATRDAPNRDGLRQAPLTNRERIDPRLLRQLEESGLDQSSDNPEVRARAEEDEANRRPLLPPDPRDGPTENDGPSQEFDLFSGPAAAPQGRAAATSRPVSPARSYEPRPEEPDLPENLAADDPRDPPPPRRSATPRSPMPAGALRAVAPRNPPLASGLAEEALAVDSPLRTSRTVLAPQRAPAVRAGDDDPFAAPGVRTSRFILYPELIQTLGASTNIDDAANGEAGIFTETTVSARLLSDWSRHEAELNGSLTYRRNFAGDNPEDPRAALDGRLRLDIDRMTNATLRGAIDYAREDTVDISDALVGTDRANRLQGSLSGQIERRFGRAVVSATGTLARTAYSDLPAGAADQDYTTLTATLRTGYEVSPAFTPFIEGSVGRRLFDVDGMEADGAFDRDALLPALRHGVAFDLTEKLRGEVALGYAWNRPDDPRGDETSAPTLDANLVWSPQRGTELTATARTRFEPESTGRSTVVAYEGSLGLRHAWNNRTELTAAAVAEHSDSTLPGEDETLLTGEAGFTYWLNRGFALTGAYSHSELYSEDGADEYGSDTIRLGVKLQR